MSRNLSTVGGIEIRDADETKGSRLGKGQQVAQGHQPNHSRISKTDTPTTSKCHADNSQLLK